ncbi:F0F1 ATP synthase subunit A [Hydrogenothermus marinus]|uniref:ATP synthase subunit a n=1 Tax=Hydrogenothermus marinus TaxID=133270 RepID=A0A3M0BA50_9AQUI|nr:F0F1 ATP synthase subunit A [Hydrogenothermus marinus]RMA93039.1 F-type H+-transporting ATPase subunit a [Hydrogenothermus marinus]
MEGLYTNHITMTIIEMIVVFAIFAIFAKNPKLVPSPIQNIFEAYIDFAKNMIEENMGKRGMKYFPLVAGIGLFVFFGNLLGMIPGLEAPTANINTTFALALLVFFYYNFEGIREQGFFKYFSHFFGPIKWMAPLYFIIEIISHLSRPLTLALRLFANMTSGEILTIVLIFLVPLLVPLPIMFIHLFEVFLQTYVFMILTTAYIATAIIEPEH